MSQAGSRSGHQQVSKSASRSMIVAGIMSGTSADGVDIALCRLTFSNSRLITRNSKLNKDRATLDKTIAAAPKLTLIAHQAFPYPRALRAAVLAAMNSQRTTTAELSRLNWRLGAFYADCVEAAVQQSGIKPQLIACHGQTIYHQANAADYLSQPTRCTWQIGEASVLAERLRLPVVSDFRSTDLAAGGQAAPLVPMLDYALFKHATKNRLLLNLGGIANITALPAASDATNVLAFDTGPANMVVDALMQRLFQKPFDRNGATASRGQVLPAVLTTFLKEKYFAASPPKSCGREEFGERFVTRILAACRKSSNHNDDAIATATMFTSATILDAYAKFCWPHLGQVAPAARGTELFVSGGGTHNATLMRQLTDGFATFGIHTHTTDALGLPSAAKEAAAFALLGWLTWHNLPGNLPSVTGASRPVLLGKVTHA